MSTSGKKYIVGGIALGFLLLISFLYFPDFIFHSGDYLTSDGGDGLKNYYTYLYYIKWDQSVKLTGMAYPFGEHIIYPDTQPALAKLLSLLNQYGFALSLSESLAVMHLFMLTTFLISAVIVYALLVRMNLPLWYCAVVTVIITMLSPQLFRFGGHFALAIVFFVPLLWYLLLRQFESQNNYVWGILLSVLITLCAFFHPYYLPIGALMVVMYVLVYAFQHRKEKDKKRKLLIFLVTSAIVPMLVFKLWMKVTDTIQDRPEAPYGLMGYRATFDSVFMPPTGPGHTFLNHFITTEPEAEGWAFVGTIGALILLFSLIRVYKWIRKKQYKKIELPPLPVALQTAIWVGVLTLLIAMAFPFRLGLEWTLDFVSPLKQFRSLGRFAWIFFYIYTIYVAYYLYQLYRLLSSRHKQFGLIFISLALFSWASEAWLSFSYATKVMHRPSENVFAKDLKYERTLNEHALRIDSFQAILPLPFYLWGTEKIDVIDAPWNSTTFIVSYQSGLPLATLLSARFSLSQGQLIKQLMSADEIDKSILQYYANKKPLLVIYSNEYKLNREEQRLLAKCEKIGVMDGAVLYRLDLNKLNTRAAVLENYNKAKSTLINHQGFLYASASPSAVSIPLDAITFEKTLLGEGVLVTKDKDELLVDKQRLPSLGNKDSIVYELSLWMYLDPEVSEITGFNLTTYNQKNEETGHINVRQELTFDIYKGWQRMSIRFVGSSNTDRISLTCSEKGITLDDILIRPADIDVYKELGDSVLYKNNYLIRMD